MICFLEWFRGNFFFTLTSFLENPDEFIYRIIMKVINWFKIVIYLNTSRPHRRASLPASSPWGDVMRLRWRALWQQAGNGTLLLSWVLTIVYCNCNCEKMCNARLRMWLILDNVEITRDWIITSSDMTHTWIIRHIKICRAICRSLA